LEPVEEKSRIDHFLIEIQSKVLIHSDDNERKVTDLRRLNFIKAIIYLHHLLFNEVFVNTA